MDLNEMIIKQSKAIVLIFKVYAWQENPNLHKLTCFNNSNHILKPNFDDENYKVFLSCPKCGYSQNLPDLFFDEELTSEKIDEMKKNEKLF